MTDAIDLTGFMPQDIATIDIMLPGSTEPTGWKITLAGPSHPKTVAWADEAARKSLRKSAQIEAMQVNGRKYKPEEETPDGVRKENVEFITRRIVDWTPVKIGADTYKFSEQTALELFSKPEMGWAYAQVVEALGDIRSFTKGSATA